MRANEGLLPLHSNRTHIFPMIHEEFNSNFSDYINKKRITFSKELMLLNPYMRMNERAEKLGFINVWRTVTSFHIRINHSINGSKTLFTESFLNPTILFTHKIFVSLGIFIYICDNTFYYV